MGPLSPAPGGRQGSPGAAPQRRAARSAGKRAAHWGCGSGKRVGQEIILGRAPLLFVIHRAIIIHVQHDIVIVSIFIDLLEELALSLIVVRRIRNKKNTYIAIIQCKFIKKVIVGPLTLTFDRVTWPLLKIDMRHEAYRHGKKY